MKSAKQTSSITETIDKKKPIVKEVVDKEKEMSDFLLLRLPHVSNARAKAVCVFRAKDESEFCFRVNWYGLTQDNAFQKVIASRYVRLITSENGYTLI